MDVYWENGEVYYYTYTPSAVAAWTFVGLFGAATVGHVVYMFPMRAPYFIPFAIGCLLETFGYYGRAWAHQEPNSINPFVLQSMLILAAPPFLGATIYMSLSNFIRSLGASHLSLLRPKTITVIYVIVDVLCVLSQVAGTGIQASGDEKTIAIGTKIILIGLIFQEVMLIIFVYIAFKFKRKVRTDRPLSRHLWVLYIQVALLWMRNLVRVVEFAQGKHGFIKTHEFMLYLFDATPMFLLCLIYLILHPGRLCKAKQPIPDF